MKITIEQAGEPTTIDGVHCRPWHGTTEKGVACTVYVTRIRVAEGMHEEFARELQETGTPKEQEHLNRAISLRHIL